MFQEIASAIVGRRYRKRKAQARRVTGCPGVSSAPSPRSAFFDAVDQIAFREGIAIHEAMMRVRDLCPALFQAAFPRETLSIPR